MNPYLDIVLRSIAVYFFMVIALRVFGKKELSQLNSSDIILILLISNSVQNAMVGPNTSLLGGITAAFVLFVINFLFKKTIFKSTFVKNLILDKPEILIHDGKTEYETLSKLGITTDELEEAMREHGVIHYDEVKLAMFETDGNISIISGKEHLKHTKHKRRIHKSLN